jgi:hypothetical protein
MLELSKRARDSGSTSCLPDRSLLNCNASMRAKRGTSRSRVEQLVEHTLALASLHAGIGWMLGRP